MELQILISKKGTKVVTASNLYGALELPEQHYSNTLLKWIDDFYEFTDGIRKPVRLADYAKRKIANNPILKDFYLSLELAKKIALRSKSKLKRKFAKQLYALQDREEYAEVLTQEQIETVLEVAKTMTKMSCQESAERKHQEIYTSRNGGSGAKLVEISLTISSVTLLITCASKWNLKAKSIRAKHNVKCYCI